MRVLVTVAAVSSAPGWRGDPAPRQSDYKSYAETLSSDLTSVDVAAITA